MMATTTWQQDTAAIEEAHAELMAVNEMTNEDGSTPASRYLLRLALIEAEYRAWVGPDAEHYREGLLP